MLGQLPLMDGISELRTYPAPILQVHVAFTSRARAGRPDPRA
jgi:hypothetical protein